MPTFALGNKKQQNYRKMNKTLKKIVEIVERHNGMVKPNSEVCIDFGAAVTYTGGDVDITPIVGKLVSVSFSDGGGEKYLTFEVESEKGNIYIDYNIRYNFTCVYYHFDDDEYNETIDKNLPIKIIRSILKSIE